jgi:protein-S-isoprenylcysteine O-methyltransferase Ste14
VPPPGLHRTLALVELLLSVPTAVALLFVTAPYGRHIRAGWGPSLPAWLGWLLMEAPAPIVFLLFWLQGSHRGELVPILLLAMWETHYAYRAFVYPVGLRRGQGRMLVSVAAMAVLFNLLNGYVNGAWVSGGAAYPATWLADPRFVVGALLFAGGLALNVLSDRALRRLRRPGETGYKVPRGGAFEWVSCPNYLGEVVEWTGWAIATWSLPGLAFAVYTAANLVPRALSHHAWYRREFPGYPPERRAVIPFLL